MAGARDSIRQKNIHIKILILCTLSIVVYVYLYKSVMFKPWSFSIPLNDTVNSLDEWGYLVNQFIAEHQDKPVKLQRNESTNSFIYQRPEWDNILKKYWKIPTEDLRLNKSDNNLTLCTNASINSSSMTSIPYFTVYQPKARNKKEINTKANTNTLLVLFTTFEDNAEKYVCRNNTLQNWRSFGSLIKPVFFTENDNLAKRVQDKGWDLLAPSKTAIEIPVLKYMFLDVMQKYRSKFYAYANGDILFTQNLIDTLQFVLTSDINITHPMLIVGQRTNVKYVTVEQASTHKKIMEIAHTGKLFTTWGEDYFITNANYPWLDIPEVVVGRVAYDNWLVLNARRKNHTTIDATKTLLAVHQTTKAGNTEGSKHKNSNFNGNLLRKLYRKINYWEGLTSCTSLYTIYNTTSHHIQLKPRHRLCK